jgi:hypothetical protein
MNRPSFLIYGSFYDPIKHLPDLELGRLFRSIFEYQLSGLEPESTDPIYMAFCFFKNQFTLDQQKYVEKCSKNSENARKRWNATACDRMETDANNADKEKEKEKEKEKDILIYRHFDHLSISIDQVNKLLENYSKEQIDSTLDRIQNYSQNKKYKSLYLTAQNWLKKEPSKIDKAKYIPTR